MPKMPGLAALQMATWLRELADDADGEAYSSPDNRTGPSLNTAPAAEPMPAMNSTSLPETAQEAPPTAPAAPSPALERSNDPMPTKVQAREPAKKVRAPGQSSRQAASPLDARRAAPASKRQAVPRPEPKATGGDRVHTSIYLPRDLRRSLRQIAAIEECKVHDLLIEALIELVSKRAIVRT